MSANTLLPSSSTSTGGSLGGSSLDQRWLETLWERYCSHFGPTSSSSPPPFDIKSPHVQTLYTLWSPVLEQFPLYPRQNASSTLDQQDYEAPRPILLTRGTPNRKRPRSSTALDGPAGHCLTPGPVPDQPTHVFCISLTVTSLLTEEMCRGVQEQPRLLLPLLTFFYAWRLYRGQEPLTPSPSSSTGDSQVSLHNGSSNSWGREERVVACEGRLYCCVAPPPPSLGSRRVLRTTLVPQPYAQIGAGQLGKLVLITGSVVRLSVPRLRCAHLRFTCQRCGAQQESETENGVLVYPGPCSGNARGRELNGPQRLHSSRVRCQGYKWSPNTATAECVEVQVARLQELLQENVLELPSADSSRGTTGSASKMLEVELRVPFLDCIAVGETVMVCGILTTKLEAGSGFGGRKGQQSPGLQLCVEALSVMPYSKEQERVGGREAVVVDDDDGLQASSEMEVVEGRAAGPLALILGAQPLRPAVSSAGSGCASVPLSLAEQAECFEIARSPRWLERLAGSLAPELFGLSMVKEALTLALIGGASAAHQPGTGPGDTTRSSIHVLLLGDPGLGKSQLLRAACRLASRSAYVCAHTSSSCGLTLTMSRDPVSGEATLEAGAVVHGDGGVTGIDEIDKGAAEHKALLEVMEQETVSVAKAGVVFSMPVHTSIFAAGNPVGGSFSRQAARVSLAEACRLSPALLSRFDLVLCLRDLPGQACGEWPSEAGGASRAGPPPSHPGTNSLTHHILGMHRTPHHCTTTRTVDTSTPPLPPLSPSLVQRFIAFARTSCRPRLTREAAAVLKAHYLEERGRPLGEENRVITPRYLQSLIRLASARAKVELRNEVMSEDAAYAVELMKGCLSTLSPPSGSLLNRSGATSLPGLAVDPSSAGSGRATGKPKNQREMVIRLLQGELVQQSARPGEVNSHLLSRKTILQACEEAGCKDPGKMMSQLNEFGVLLQSGDMFSLRV